MLFEPRVVLGTLDGKIQRDFQAMVGGGLDQATEVVTAAQLRVDGVMTARLAANCVGAARILRARRQGIVLALAMAAADRMDRRKIEDVEPHVVDHRQA